MLKDIKINKQILMTYYEAYKDDQFHMYLYMH